MELTVKDVLKMENIMNKVKDVVSNSVTITDHKSAGSIRLTECTMPEFEGFDICYLPDNKEETGSYIGSFFIENADSDKPKLAVLFIRSSKRCVHKVLIQNGRNSHIVTMKMRFYISMEKTCMSGRL